MSEELPLACGAVFKMCSVAVDLCASPCHSDIEVNGTNQSVIRLQDWTGGIWVQPTEHQNSNAPLARID